MEIRLVISPQTVYMPLNSCLGAVMDDASTRFPFISLEKAMHRAEQLYAADKSGKPMLVSVAFELWSYGPKSSGAFQTVAALKSYGLIDDDGSSIDRRIKLTEMARRYFLDERDDVRAAMLSQFALSPPLLRVLWTSERWSEGVPADTVARSYLKIDRGLNDQSARVLLSIFKDNVRFAGLKSSVSLPPSVESNPAAERSETAEEAGKVPKMPETDPRGFTPPPPAPSLTPHGKPIVFDMESVTVSARFDNLEDLQDFIEKLEKLAPLMPLKNGLPPN